MNNCSIIERYYRQHRDELLTFVSSRLGGDVMAAEDLVQELFLRLLSDGRRPIAEATLGSLAYTMARHLVTDHYRRRYYQHLYEQQAQLTGYDDILPTVYARETIAHIEQRLHHLSEPVAEVYRLHLYGGMKVGEISRCLQQDYKAVEYRLGQARREVRRLLSSC